MLIALFSFLRRRVPLPCLLILFVAFSAISVRAQEIMIIERLSVRSENSTLVTVDSEGKTKSAVPANESASSSNAVVSQIGPGERVEVSGESPAQMIISEGVTAHLEPGTQIEIPKIEKDKKPKVSLKLLKGKMFIKVDAEKLRQQGNVEFRLETTKSLLAVKGTEFVVESGDKPNSVALLEGSVAVKDLETGKAALLRPGQATDVIGSGDLVVRRFNESESEYSEVFAREELRFIPYEIDKDSISTGITKILPLAKNGAQSEDWVQKPETFSAKLVRFDEFSSRGIRAEFAPDTEEEFEKAWVGLSFGPRKLKRPEGQVIGLLITSRSTCRAAPELKSYIDFDRTMISMANGQGKLPNPQPGTWQSQFLLTESREASTDDELGKFRALGDMSIFYRGGDSSPEAHHSPFVLEIVSIQLVTLGSEEE